MEAGTRVEVKGNESAAAIAYGGEAAQPTEISRDCSESCGGGAPFIPTHPPTPLPTLIHARACARPPAHPQANKKM